MQEAKHIIGSVCIFKSTELEQTNDSKPNVVFETGFKGSWLLDFGAIRSCGGLIVIFYC